MKDKINWDSTGEFQHKTEAAATDYANMQMWIENPVEFTREQSVRHNKLFFDALAKAEASALTGIKHDADKVRVDLLPFEALEEVAKVLTFGAKKYSDENWRGGFKYSRVIGAALRHLFAWKRGVNADDESKISHLAHAACCILFLLTFELTKTGQDDRFKYGGAA